MYTKIKKSIKKVVDDINGVDIEKVKQTYDEQSKKIKQAYKGSKLEKQVENFFDWLKKAEVIELDKVNTADDPVSPELDNKFRTSYGRKIYGLKDDTGEVVAYMCFAFTNHIPKTVKELELFSIDAYNQGIHRAGVVGNIAIAYTVWSKKKGGGKRIVKEVFKLIKKSHHLNRLITLSPLTIMARKFHLRNGAVELQVNKETQNFEYFLEKPLKK